MILIILIFLKKRIQRSHFLSRLDVFSLFHSLIFILKDPHTSIEIQCSRKKTLKHLLSNNINHPESTREKNERGTMSKSIAFRIATKLVTGFSVTFALV